MTDGNREQIDLWNGARGATWVADQEELDRALAPFGRAALAAADVQPGEAVLDVGCGCGASTLALAEQVGASGRVHGVDVSEAMLARAWERAAGSSNIHFSYGDASRMVLPRESSLLFSRFGVMFFDEPAKAFAHLATALLPGARLTFVCWRGLADNPWLAVPFAAARQVAPHLPVPPPRAPGPLAFGEADYVRQILSGPFTDVTLTPFDHPMPLGDGTGLASAVDDALTRGPMARLLADIDETTRSAVKAALEPALTPYLSGNGVTLGAGVWIVTANVG